MRNFEGMRYAFFKRTIDKNIVKEPRWHAKLPNAFINMVFNERPPESAIIEDQEFYEDAEQNPLTQRYFESTIGKVEKPVGVGTWIAEVARVAIPKGRVAVIKGFEQFASHPDLQGDTIFSGHQQWGNPFFMSDTDLITSVQWLFRIQQTEGTVQPFLNAIDPPVIPGSAHRDCPVFDDLWFPVHNSSAQNIHVTIGGNKTLRVFAQIVISAEYDLTVAAKIKGYHISEFDDMTKLAVRSIW